MTAREKTQEVNEERNRQEEHLTALTQAHYMAESQLAALQVLAPKAEGQL